MHMSMACDTDHAGLKQRIIYSESKEMTTKAIMKDFVGLCVRDTCLIFYPVKSVIHPD
jgi:hypothetical protein